MSDATPTPAATPAAAPAAAPAATPAPAPAPAATPAAAPAAAATPAPAAAAAPLASDDWRADLPDELKEHASRFTSKADLVKGHLTLRQQLSKAIIPPGKDAKPEDVANYRKALGVPDAPEGYKFPVAEGEAVTEEMKASQATWAKRFHDRNISAAAAEGLLADFRSDLAAQQAAIVAADKRFSEEAEAANRKLWGADYDKNLRLAQLAAFGSPLVEGFAQKAGIDPAELNRMETKDGRLLFDNPLFARFLAAIGREMGEGTLGPVVDADQKAQMDTQLRTIREGIERAKQGRDSKEANRLYQEEMKLIARIQGNRPIVGAGRAA